MNERFIERTGYDGVGDLCYKALHNFDSICPWCVNDRVFSGETVKWEVKSPKDNRWYYVVNTPISHLDGTISKMAMILDITEQKEAQQKLKESEEKFAKAFNSNALSMSISSIEEGRFVEVNDVFLDDLGFKREEVIGKTSEELNIWVERSQRDLLIQTLKEEGKVTNMQCKYRTKENKIKYGLFSVNIIILNEKPYLLNIVNDITRRVHYEQKLKESEEQYRTTINSLADPLLVINRDFKIVLLNSAFKQWLDDLSVKKDILGLTVFEAFPFLPDEVREEYERVFNNREITFTEGSTLLDNKEVITESRKIPIFKEGNVSQVITIVRDITKRKNTEKKLKESEEKYRALIENVNDVIFTLDIEGNFTYTSPVIEQFSGYKVDEIIGKAFSCFIFPEDLPHLLASFERTLAGRKEPLEFRIIVKDGSIRHVLTSSSLIIKQGQPEGLIGVMTDVTNRKKAEIRLKESEENYRLITENANDLISIVNPNFKVEFINEQTYFNILGYSKEDIIGKTGFNFVHPDDLERGINAYKEGLVKSEGIVELRLRHKQGHYQWFEFKGKKYLDPKGNIKGLLIGREISKRKEAEQLILEENRKLLELENMRENIINRISHELKTPLTLVISGSELLTTVYRNQLKKEAQEITEMINRGGSRLKLLIENLLDTSKIDNHKFELTRKRENLIDLISESIKDLSFFAQNRQLNINLNLPNTIFFNIDKFRMQQAITNILSNAIKNTPKGGDIYITAEENLEYIKIKIKDTGVGLTNEEKIRLFEKFGKIERYGSGLDVDIEGSGLGLYISKHIVTAHNGEILVESEGRNKGSLFIIRLRKKEE